MNFVGYLISAMLLVTCAWTFTTSTQSQFQSRGNVIINSHCPCLVEVGNDIDILLLHFSARGTHQQLLSMTDSNDRNGFLILNGYTSIESVQTYQLRKFISVYSLLFTHQSQSVQGVYSVGSPLNASNIMQVMV